jgi:hypothetical protein
LQLVILLYNTYHGREYCLSWTHLLYLFFSLFLSASSQLYYDR